MPAPTRPVAPRGRGARPESTSRLPFGPKVVRARRPRRFGAGGSAARVGQVDGQIVVQWLTPILLAGFGAAFLIAWRHDPARRSALALGASYMCGALAFGVELLFVNEDPVDLTRSVEDAFYLATAALLGMGVTLHLGARVRPALIGALVLAGLGTNVWYSTVDPDMGPRTLALSLSTSALMATGLLHGWGRRRADRLVLAALALLCLAVTANALANSAALGGLAAGAYETTLFSAVLNLAVSVLGAALAVTLLVDQVLRRLERMAVATDTDPLTGALNRRGFERRAAAIAAAGRPAVLVLTDIDHFKRVNDAHGHPAGDEVLRRFARVLVEAGAPGCVVGRIGGEEFAVLAPGLDLRTGRLMAEGIRLAVAGVELSDIAPGLSVTASFGVAPLGRDPMAAYAAADALLYCSKSSGRDRVTCAAEDAAARLRA